MLFRVFACGCRSRRFFGQFGAIVLGGVLLLAACTPPEPPARNLPTLPAVLDITAAPTLDIDATATAFAQQLRPSPTPAGLYVVQPGDTLSGLAAQFNTTVDEIVAANNLTDPNALQPGQSLIIPVLLRTPAAAEPQSTITITPQNFGTQTP